ncbi:MAG: YihY family inner membrane protein [Betaproteobacteria bacterium]|nr:YihY family inner membrane protein [Betaproteobacteria bacterium]
MLPRIDNALRRGSQFARLVAARFADDRCVQVAGNLTFTTLLALVPLFTIALTLFAAFPMFQDWSNAFKVFLLTTLVPEVSGKVITVYMQQFSDNAGKLTAVGLIFLAVTALMLMVNIERVFNGIWRARRNRSVVQRLVMYWTTITVGPLLIGASLSLTSWLVTESMQSVSGVRGAQELLLKLLPIVLNGAAFALLYIMIPNRRVLVKDALVGGITAAVGFEVMKRGFGVYVMLFPTYDLIYGTFATIPIFLLWIYLSWLVVLLGAVVVAVLPHWRMGARQPLFGDGGALYRALRLIELLHEARLQSQTPTVSQLVARSGIPEEEVEQLLETMNAPGWARRVEPAGWVLVRDLQTLRLVELYRLLGVRSYEAQAGDGELVRAAGGLLAQVEQELDVPLGALSNGNDPANAAEPSLSQPARA